MSTLQDLSQTLAVTPAELAGLGALPDSDVAQLTALIEAAFTAETTAFDEAMENTVQSVPRLLRGRARALLFGGEA